VRTNADTPRTHAARGFGAQGIGLCRTEHAFGDRNAAVRRMILADNDRQRQAAWTSCRPAARGLHRHLHGHGRLPVTIRLLDPPPHEFPPQGRSAGGLARSMLGGALRRR
jgi:pyruvate,orthophosphate dikinase